MTQARHLPSSRPLQAWLLAALLLLAQGWGLAHRVAHAPGLGHAGVAHAAPGRVQGPVSDHAHVQAAVSWAAGHEADTAECRLIDQLAHADGLCADAWAVASAPRPNEAHGAAPPLAPRAGSASAYLARAPPLA